MAPKRDLVKNRDQFIVRLPNGMRERIKAGADRAGMSMNEAIVWCLEQHFPEPETFETRIEDLAEMVAMLKEDGRQNEVLDNLIGEIHRTILEISDGKIVTPPDFKRHVSDRLDRWNEEQAEIFSDLHENPFKEPEPGARWVPAPGGDLDDET